MGPPTKINSPWQRQIASFIREYTIRARECISRLSRSIDQRARAGRDLVATETPTSGTAIVHQDTRMFRFLWSSGYIRRRCACPLVCLSVQPFVRPSIRPFVCLSVCLSVRPSVRPSVRSFVRSSVVCSSALRTSASPSGPGQKGLWPIITWSLWSLRFF